MAIPKEWSRINIHPITGFKRLEECFTNKQSRVGGDVMIEPLKRSDVRDFVGEGVNVSSYMFEAFRGL
jgi:hypothetical protein